MLGTCGEIIIDSTNSTDDIIEKIKDYEKSIGITLPSRFVIKKIGIKVENDCEVKINNKSFHLSANEPLEFGYDVWDIKNIVAVTEEVKMVIRYLY